MLLVSFSIDYHVVCNPSDSWHIEKDCIEFSLEYVLCHARTHWKMCPLEPSNVQCHCSQLPGFRVWLHHPVSFVEVHYGEMCHAMELA